MHFGQNHTFAVVPDLPDHNPLQMRCVFFAFMADRHQATQLRHALHSPNQLGGSHVGRGGTDSPPKLTLFFLFFFFVGRYIRATDTDMESTGPGTRITITSVFILGGGPQSTYLPLDQIRDPGCNDGTSDLSFILDAQSHAYNTQFNVPYNERRLSRHNTFHRMPFFFINQHICLCNTFTLQSKPSSYLPKRLVLNRYSCHVIHV